LPVLARSRSCAPRREAGSPFSCVRGPRSGTRPSPGFDRNERDAQRFWIHLIETLADAAGDEVVDRVSAAPRFAGAALVERLRIQLERLDDPSIW
jgi:hypothetical protein